MAYVIEYKMSHGTNSNPGLQNITCCGIFHGMQDFREFKRRELYRGWYVHSENVIRQFSEE